MSYEIKYVTDKNDIWYQASLEEVLRELRPQTRLGHKRRMQYLDQLEAGRWVITQRATIRKAQR